MRDPREHWEEFSRSAAEARGVCLLTDFDGTLTPLQERPDLAVFPSAGRRLLKELACRSGLTVGVVSGRSLEDIRERVGVESIWYVGNHGFEIRTPKGRVQRFFDAEDARYLHGVRNELEGEVSGVVGAIVENKGPVVALHYRMVEPAGRAAVEKAFQRVAERHRRRVMVGRGSMVLEIRMRGNCNKGTAIRFIRRHLPAGTAIYYFGDDLTDRDAFRALRGGGVSVQVGEDDAGLADYCLPHPGAVLEVLDRLAETAKSQEGGSRRRPSRRKERTERRSAD